MLFNNYEPYAIPENGDISRETLKAKFPEFYEGKIVSIHALDSLFATRKRFIGDSAETRVEAGFKRVPPEPTGHKAVANIVIDGKQINLQYAETMPTMDNNRKGFVQGTNRLRLSHGFKILPHQEDLLFFMYFGLGVFSNSYNPSRSPMYEFHRPSAKAQDVISKFNQRTKFENMVFNELSEGVVKVIMGSLGIDLLETDAENRVLLLRRVTSGNDELKSKFWELVDVHKEKDEISVINDGKPTFDEISDIVSKKIDSGDLKNDSGKWYTKSKIKVGEWNTTPIFDSREQNADNSRLKLVEELRRNEATLKRLQ